MKQHFKMAALSLAVISATNAFAQDSSEPEYKTGSVFQVCITTLTNRVPSSY